MAVASERQQLVIIGAGMAGSKLAGALLEHESQEYDVTLIGEETHAGYNRIMLSSLLANEISAKDMTLVDIPALQAIGLKLILADPVVDICTKKQQLILRSGAQIAYNKLVFATGSRASILPILGSDAVNVMGFRNLQDISKIESLTHGSDICVIGGGLLGLEAAVGLVKRGHKVTLVHRAKHILNRQLDEVAAQLLEMTLTQMGIHFRLGFAPESLVLDDEKIDSETLVQEKRVREKRVTGIVLSNGEQIATSLVVMATGITPEVTLAGAAGLEIDKAIKVNAMMETSIENIYALGECCEFEGQTFGLVAPIWQQLDSLLERLKQQDRPFFITPTPTKLKISGIHLFSVGNIAPKDTSGCISLIDEKKQLYRKLVIEDGKLVGIILYGDVADGAWYFQLLQNQIDIETQLDQIIFGEAYCSLETSQLHIENNKVA